jgi:hypothetical protein
MLISCCEESEMKRIGIVLFVIMLLLSTLACRVSFELPWDVGAPDVEISPDDIAAAATRAANVAATAAVIADQAGQVAATAVLQGDNIMSTAVAGEDLPRDSGAATGASSLERKLTSISPDANGNFTITMTDADLAEYLAIQGAAFENSDARIENVQVSFTPQNVVINGNITNPVNMPLTAQLKPVVVDGRLHFQVLNASAGVLPVPDSMLSILETGINVGLGQAMNSLPVGVTLLDVALGSGSMTVLGRGT